MSAIDPNLAALSAEDRRVFESWVIDFDRSWHDGSLEAWLSRLPAPGQLLRLPMLREMVKIDLERQWQFGRRACLEGYLHKYPELGTLDSVPLDLIQAEYEVRHQFGATAELVQFAQRFPRQAAPWP